MPLPASPAAIDTIRCQRERTVPIERLAVSPQCVFGTTASGAPMNEAEQQAKSKLVGRDARTVWGST